ncbi:hypothetical protein BSBH6_03928 [Bacillus subtilis]|nr:hypothetical protein BSBH6_03928 [Bacillus subtilis]RPK20138.1 hypothetical protein BH5_03929 [Bacillus subtilis]
MNSRQNKKLQNTLLKKLLTKKKLNVILVKLLRWVAVMIFEN